MATDCQFCHIVTGDADAHRLYEDEHTVAFLDSNPAVAGHTLVVPTAHRTDILTATEQTVEAVFRTVRTVGTALDHVLDPDGFSVFHSTGTVVGNVEHAHVHLLPRYEDDEVTLSLARYELPDDEGDRIASQVRTVLSVESGGMP